MGVLLLQLITKEEIVIDGRTKADISASIEQEYMWKKSVLHERLKETGCNEEDANIVGIKMCAPKSWCQTNNS